MHLFGFIIKKFFYDALSHQRKKVRKNFNKPRKIPNTTRNIAGNLSASWQYGNNICGLPTASFLLVCKLCKSVSRERKIVLGVSAWTKSWETLTYLIRIIGIVLWKKVVLNRREGNLKLCTRKMECHCPMEGVKLGWSSHVLPGKQVDRH